MNLIDSIANLNIPAGQLFLGAVFVAVVMLTLAVTTITRSWADIRRRTASSVDPSGASLGDNPLLVTKGQRESFLDVLLPKKESERGELRRFLDLAGYRSPAAPAILQVIRIGSAVVIGGLTAANAGTVMANMPFPLLVGVTLLLTLAGYMLPKTLVSFKRDSLIEEHRQGFPDFLDLLVICIDAGIGIDSAIERVSRDMKTAYPSLAYNLQMMSLEIRAGRSLRDAMENLASRLGIDEAKSFATLLQQSEELGSSLVQSLRVYSEEMRQKRLSRAEEKASALPAKLVIPLGLFIFPVILAVVLTPVIIKIYKALGIS